MDIWRWIEGLDEDISDSMYDLANAVSEAEHNRVDSLVPMLVGTARERGLPWVEVFARHWELQSLIFHRYNPRNGMPKAVALLERSHRDDMIDCPQTICVSQDVCAAYGMADGPGYAKDRIAVCEETFERINPAWSCWTCIVAEKGAALIDVGAPDTALDFIEKSERLISKAGGDPEAIDMRRIKIEALGKLERCEEGLELARKTVAEQFLGEAFTFECNALAVQMLAQLGRYDEALADLSAINDVLDRGRTDVHGSTLATLVRGGAMAFDDDRIRDFAVMVQRDIDRGAFRMAADVGVLAVELCVDKNLAHAGYAFAELTVQAIEKLRAKDAAKTRLDAAISRLADPDDEAPDLAGWQKLGFLSKAAVLAKAAHENSPQNLELFKGLARLYLDMNAYDDLRSLLDKTVDSSELGAYSMWYRSLLEERTQGRDAAISCMKKLVTNEPDWGGANWRLAYLLDAAGEYREALAAYNSTIALFDESGGYDWDRMVVAARIDEHDAVRDSAARLDIELKGDTGPIDEDWGDCLVHYDDDTNVLAVRTGPVTARIERLARFAAPERYKDEIVIMPRPENPDADENDYRIYPHVQTIRTGNFRSYIVDGVHPGEEKLAKFRDKVEAAGFVFEQTSDEQYELNDPQSGENVCGVFLRIAIPEGYEAIEVHTLLTEVVNEVGIEVLTWLDLLADLKLDDELGAQTKLADEWGI